MNKKLRIDTTGIWAGKVLSLVNGAWKLAVSGIIISGGMAVPAMAGDLKSNMDFWNTFSESKNVPGYNIARDAMNDSVFKNSPYDKNQSPADAPLLSVASYDLNGDGIPEILAMPIDDYEEGAPPRFCKEDEVCPYYILQKDGQRIRNMGVIWARTLNHGKKKINGYETLEAFTKSSDPSYFETYAYAPQIKGYILSGMSKTAETKPAAKNP